MPRGAERLINNMTNDVRIDYDNDWKMITMFIGGNDLCAYCEDPEYYSPSEYVTWIREALDMLQDQVPRAFVNLVPMMDVTPIHSVFFHVNNTNYTEEPTWEGLYPWMCHLIHLGFCRCIMNETGRLMIKRVQQDYFYGLNELIESGRYDIKDDFTVILQPHLKDQQMLVDLTPVGQKPYSADPDQTPGYICPTEKNPYLFTYDNSAVSGSERHSFSWTLFTWILFLVTIYSS
ncbi:hypothetical protein LSH36_367g07008 [Paralvinella palmiformis]|uniref:Phospholipase B1, membrane-associated-like n=1 Tax=Paralvinella palmiformis TaxID=53620 RepID=A0AAD9N0W1_9ANNE|nr:hypothetical protein LSH36_367g07008 [Paralvinella palmiformis]